MAPADAVDVIAVLSIPGGQVEAPRRHVLFAVQMFEQRNDLVTVGQNAVRIVDQDLTERLIGRVVDLETSGFRRDRLFF